MAGGDGAFGVVETLKIPLARLTRGKWSIECALRLPGVLATGSTTGCSAGVPESFQCGIGRADAFEPVDSLRQTRDFTSQVVNRPRVPA